MKQNFHYFLVCLIWIRIRNITCSIKIPNTFIEKRREREKVKLKIIFIRCETKADAWQAFIFQFTDWLNLKSSIKWQGFLFASHFLPRLALFIIRFGTKKTIWIHICRSDALNTKENENGKHVCREHKKHIFI